MTSRDFAYWLQGFFELANPSSLTKEQTKLIKAHLSLVFVHEIDPSMGPPDHQKKLDEIHSKTKLPAIEIDNVEPGLPHLPTGVTLRC